MPRTVKEIIEQAQQLAHQFTDVEPDPADRPRAEALAAVHRAVLARADAEAALAEAIAQARQAGASWASIGTVLGTSGEAARQRYGPEGRPRKAG
jgi:hypothetical protein